MVFGKVETSSASEGHTARNMKTDKHIIYDVEVYPNVFTLTALNVRNEQLHVFEVSERKNDYYRLRVFMEDMRRSNAEMIGFNNIGYDYPVLHSLCRFSQIHPDAASVTKAAFNKSQEIIKGVQRFEHTIRSRDEIAKQIDLLKIHHFDNTARSTSLKMLEFVMRSNNIQDLPFDPEKPIECFSEIDQLLKYNRFDVEQTFKFYKISLEKMELRDRLSRRYKRDFTNASDTKIGSMIFQLSLERKLGKNVCFQNGKPRQTHRKSIKVSNILQDIPFERPEFQAVYKWLKKQVITDTKGAFTDIEIEDLGPLENFCEIYTPKTNRGKTRAKNVNCVIDGFKFVFGTGGLHGCVHGQTVESDSEHVIVDLDVASYYPSLAISNRYHPKHLTGQFCDVYKQLRRERTAYKKGTPENAALKLALNGVYGDSNNKYSCFYDPQYTMQITLNGQLLLCLLCEWCLRDVNGLQMIQANTDGITVKIPRCSENSLRKVIMAWQDYTKLTLEKAVYLKMCIRDVNNYIAVYEDGRVKRKGSYEYELELHQNQSALVVRKAAEAYALHGTTPEEFILNHDDQFDFYLRTKVPRSSRLELHTKCLFQDDKVEKLQRITRYFVSNGGGSLIKVMPPLPKAPDAERSIAIEKGFLVTVHNKASAIFDVNYKYYIDEAWKLINGFNNTK